MTAAAFLRGPTIELRPLTTRYLTDDYLRWLNDAAVTRFLEVGRYPVTMAGLRSYLRRFEGSKTDFAFAIIHRRNKKHIGNVTLNRLHPIHRTADTGLMIGERAFWGRGYAYEAWSLLITWAFARLGVRRIVAGAVVGNEASIRTLRKLGFREEGRLRGDVLVDAEPHDVLRFGLFPPEFNPKPGIEAPR